MSSFPSRCYFFLCLCSTLAFSALPAFAVPRYNITDLGILHGGKYVFVTGINSKGRVVGWVKFGKIQVFCSRTRGFLWNGKMQDLGIRTGFPNCKAFAVNDHDEIVGQDLSETHQLEAYAYQLRQQSFVWKSGRRTILPAVNIGRDNPNGADIGAIAINNRSQVLGHAGLWQNNKITAIDLYPSGINDAGQVAGQKLAPYIRGTPNNDANILASHPFLWKDGRDNDLGLLPGSGYAEATGINSLGYVVGWMESFPSASGVVREYSFLWDGSHLVRLKDLMGYSSSRAHGINAQGQVVGKCVRHRGYAHACCWQNGTIMDLNDCIPEHTGWILEAAYGINNRGQIIGIGTHGRTHFRAFLLTPRS